MTSISTTACPAKNLDATTRKNIALKIITGEQSITETSQQYSTSRKFISKQATKVSQSIDRAFENNSKKGDKKILFYIPVTSLWLRMFVICLFLHARCPYRGVISIFKDLLDYDISIGNIHNISRDAIHKAEEINTKEDLSKIKIGVPDEKFHDGRPILTGTDTHSLYCYLMSQEDDREGDTWAIHLWDLIDKQFGPERNIGDGGTGLRAGHALALPTVPLDYDNFHILMDFVALRLFNRNRLKTANTELKEQQDRQRKALLKGKKEFDETLLRQAEVTQKKMKHLSSSIDILFNWMHHDVLMMAGSPLEEREELYNFIVDELKVLEAIEPHRIKKVRVTLENQRDLVLGFVTVLDEKFKVIANTFKYPLEVIWNMCRLLRCEFGSDTYAVRSIPLQDSLGSQFDDIEDAVIEAMDSTERTSSMAENLHSRISPYLFLRKHIDNGFLSLLRFYLNHKPFTRSAHAYRKGKTPAEILNGEPHPHLLKMLGFELFKRAA